MDQIENLTILWGQHQFATGHNGGVEKLTPCEARVLALLVAGLSNRQIAEETFVSVNTVKYHLKNVYSKIGATGRAHAVRRANEIGLFVWRGSDVYISQTALLRHVQLPTRCCPNQPLNMPYLSAP